MVKSAVYDVGQQGVLGIVQIEDKQQSDAKCLQCYTRCITQAFASNRRTPKTSFRVLAHKLSHTTKTAHHPDALFCWWGQQGSSTAKRKGLHFEASVQCDRGTGAQGFAQRRITRLIRARCCFPTHKKSTTHNVARFLMWWGQQGSNL